MERDKAIGAAASRPSAEPSDHASVVGGRLRIGELLGRGGVGSVYRAYDTASDRVVALKRLDVSTTTVVSGASRRAVAPSGSRPQADGSQAGGSQSSGSVSADDKRKQSRRDAQLVALFQREYHTLAQLAHPRIIEVYDYGLDERGPYYTMELLDGQDLSQVAPLPWRRACEVMRDVASALTLLHARRLLHRDISPRNVHCSPRGHAKLIDFGAMTPTGPSDVLVGTPAFVAPEALQRQALDPRTDLYSLGALGYFLLTGRAAYPARSFSELHDLHRSHPLPPSAHAKDVPEALDALVMQLMSMDRAARPGSAVELVERLTALAGLEHDPRLAVANAYLATPSLVGRQRELVGARRRTLRAIRGHGASLLVTGPAGVGRSRFLDACALEGKLAGAYVLRGAPGAAGGADHGVVRSLLLQLHASLSDAERRAFEPPSMLRAQLVPGLIWTRANSRPVSLRPAPVAQDPMAQDPATIPRALHEYLARLVESRTLMIVIDDFHAIDEPSAAVIAGLAPIASRSRLVVVVACTSHAPASAEAALRLLKGYSRALPLEPLHGHDVESLLESVFGAVPNLVQVAHRLHALSEGMPRLCMELAQHLVDAGIIGYATGGFVLPEALSASDLPDSIEAALLARFERLSANAREVAAVVALCAGAPLTIEQCMVLALQDDRAQGERALTELVASQLVVIEDEHITLRQGVLGEALVSGLPEATLQELHARIAELLAGDPELRVAAAQHYFRGGHAAAGLDLLMPFVESGRLVYETAPGFHELIENAKRACGTLKRPLRESFLLRRAQLHHRIHYTEACDTRELIAFAHALCDMSGLTQWHALSDSLDTHARLTRALELANEAYEKTPEVDRIYAPIDAIGELARYLPQLAGHGCATFDLELIEQVPSLADYVLLAPGIELAEWIVCALRDLRASRHDSFVAGIHRVLARLDQPDHAGLPAQDYLVIRLGILYAVAMTDGALGDPKAFARADELQELPSMRISAWRVRQIAHLYRGDAQQAERCRKQLELLMIQHGPKQAHQGTTLETELMCYARSDDLLNVRRLLPELEAMTSKHAGWRPLCLLAQAELERIRGRLEAARVLYEQVLDLARPGRHMIWPYVAGFHVRVLVDTGHAREAKEIGLVALALAEQHEMGALCNHVSAALAHADAELGEHDAATGRLDTLIVGVEARRISGMFAGMLYESRARVALRMRDARGFVDNIEKWRVHYGTAPDSPFTASAARLVAEARRAGLTAELTTQLAESVIIEGTAARMHRELALCTDSHERAERALVVLIQVTGAQLGHLYGLQNNDLKLLASSHTDPPDNLQGDLVAFIAALDQADRDVTEVIGPGAEVLASTAAVITSHDSSAYSPFALGVERDTKQVVGVVALSFTPGFYRAPARELLAAIGEELVVRGDLTDITITR